MARGLGSAGGTQMSGHSPMAGRKVLPHLSVAGGHIQGTPTRTGLASPGRLGPRSGRLRDAPAGRELWRPGARGQRPVSGATRASS